jgi:hypothetical protein
MYRLDRLSSQSNDNLHLSETRLLETASLKTGETNDNRQQGAKIMDIPTQLSLEQQFKLEVLRDQVKSLSREQAQEYLLEVLRQNMVKDNLFKHLLKRGA